MVRGGGVNKLRFTKIKITDHFIEQYQDRVEKISKKKIINRVYGCLKNREIKYKGGCFVVPVGKYKALVSLRPDNVWLFFTILKPKMRLREKNKKAL